MVRNKEANVNKYDWFIHSDTLRHFTNKKDWCLDFVANKRSFDSMIFGGGEEYKIARKCVVTNAR
jgi:hypothetical protein